jgi:hypothetical protein
VLIMAGNGANNSPATRPFHCEVRPCPLSRRRVFFSFILVGKRVASWHRLERSAVGKETPRQLSSCFLVDDALVEGKYRTEPRRGRPFERNYSLTNFEWGCTTGMFEHIHETGAFRSTC